MKKVIALLLTAVVLCVAVFAVACTPAEPDKDITGIEFTSRTVDYNGNQHSVTISGILPDGAQVAYTYKLQGSDVEITNANGVADVGVYNVTATVTCKGYKTRVLTATLTINPLHFNSNLTLKEADYRYDGYKHRLQVDGSLPTEGAIITYTYTNTYTGAVTTDSAGVAELGIYEVKAEVSRLGYETVTLYSSMQIWSNQFEVWLSQQDVYKGMDTTLFLKNKTVVYDGNFHKLDLYINNGTQLLDLNRLPGDTGINATYNGLYEAAGVKDVGVYEVVWVISRENYKTVTLKATLTIKAAEEQE